MTDLTKHTQLNIAALGKRNFSCLHARIHEAKPTTDPFTCENRIAILADTSGSMSGEKIKCLKDALFSFFQVTNFASTSVALYDFPSTVRYNLSTSKEMLLVESQNLPSNGNSTPLGETMNLVLSEVSLTRGIIISDGCADVPRECLEIAEGYKETDTPLDCVHIGNSSNGEDLLKKIAEITGGIYIKFDNVSNFAKAFSFLTPENRGELTSGRAILALGCKEIIK